jgi:hypothetical protein
MSDRIVKRGARTVWFAVAVLCLINAPPVWAERAQPAGPPPKPMPSLPVLMDSDPLAVETVTFSDPRHHPVKVLRGLRPTAAVRLTPLPNAVAIPAPRKEITSFGSGLADRVIVVRGATSIPAGFAHAIPPGSNARVENVSFSDPRQGSVKVVRAEPASRPELRPEIRQDISFTIARAADGLFDAANGGELDRVAFAVDGVESRHGADARMWRAGFDGPQGPMQVSAAAAFDVGGGDRFDIRQNRLLGRAYLAQMFQRYGNWPDAIAAYNWGPGNMDQWIGSGRPLDRLPIGVVRYTNKVLRDALVVANARL